MTPKCCPICTNELTSKRVLETHEDKGIDYSLHECETCGVAFWLPLKNPGSDWYEHDERYQGANKNPPREPNSNHRRTISLLGKRTGRVLDIGCGTGNFLSYAAYAGWEPFGIDFDANAVRAATEVFALPKIELSSLEEYVARHPEYNGTFDLVTFFDVFEHLDAHGTFARLVHGLLAPGGRIAMSMPYRHGARWLQPNDLPPRHLTRWDEHSLTVFWKRYGFESVVMTRVPATFSAILMKFRFKYGKAFSFGLVRKASGRIVKNLDSSSVIDGKVLSNRLRYRLFLFLARVKDSILFGIPASITWMFLVGRKERYTGLYALFAKAESDPDS